VGVSSRSRVKVHVKESRGLSVHGVEARLLFGFTYRGVVGTLTAVHVSSWLHPNLQSTMPVQDDAA
jgi:hypothetical protein